jgi:hypothetical protein
MTEFDSIPYNEEIEQIVIGSVLIDPTVFPNLASFIKPEDFFWCVTVTSGRHFYGLLSGAN